MRVEAETLTPDLVDKLKPQGRCEFVNDFARIMPVTMFLGIVDLPLDHREQFVEWGLTLMTSTIAKEKLTAQSKVVQYLNRILAERAAAPGEDLLSRIAQWPLNPRYQGEYEVIGMALLVFFGGLDTVANLLSFTAEHLARHPGQRRRLIEQPEIIPQGR